jgi:hypothetical protein
MPYAVMEVGAFLACGVWVVCFVERLRGIAAAR